MIVACLACFIVVICLSSCSRSETSRIAKLQISEKDVKPFKVIWKAEPLPNEVSNPHQIELAGNMLVAYGYGNILCGYDVRNGQRKWTLTYGADFDKGLFRTCGNEVFVPISANSKQSQCLIADIDSRSGKEIRRYKVGDLKSIGDPDDTKWADDIAISDKYIVVLFFQGEIRAFDRATGEIIWDLFKPEKPSDDNWPPYYLDMLTLCNDLLVSYRDGNLTAISCNSGEILWRVPCSSKPFYQPNGLLTEQLYIVGGKAYDVRTGEIRWEKYAWENNYNLENGVISQGRYLAIRVPRKGHLGVACVDPVLGNDLWIYDTPSIIEFTMDTGYLGPVVADGVVYFATNVYNELRLIALDLLSGKEICKTEADVGESGGVPPVTDGKYLYLYNRYFYKLQMVR